MSSYDTWLNVLTGISQGSFDKIYLRDASGNMVDLLTLLGSLGSVTDVISNSSELVVTMNERHDQNTHAESRRIRGQHCINKCVGRLHRHDCPGDLPGGEAKYTYCGDWDRHFRGHHILHTHAHHSTTGRYNTEWCNDIKFCRQQCKFCEQCAEHLSHGMAGCLDATIQQLSQ